MPDQDQQFCAAYGEAVLFAHLIEDLVASHLFECSYFHENGYRGLSIDQIRALSHEDRINELLQVYQSRQDSRINSLVDKLHLLRRIRNQLTHAFFPEVGSDFRSQEGVDQIVAMLKSVSTWERACFSMLFEMQETVLNGALKHQLKAVVHREDRPFDARVARSKIQKYLEKLQIQFRD